MLKARAYMTVAALLAAACGAPGPLEPMQRGETARVVRVIDGDALALSTGQSVRLVGIEAPAMNWRDEDPDPYAPEASRVLEDLVMGRRVRLYYPGLTRDRYDRALAHLETADDRGPRYWINEELVRRGAARVRLYPDTSGGSEPLLKAEDLAREAGAGLWALQAYTPTESSDLAADARGFMLVRTRLGEAEAPPAPSEDDRRGSLACVRRSEKGALLVEIAGTARGLCETPVGRRVELRGWVSDGRLDLNHPMHLQPLQDD